ncbi:ABC transporter permease [Lacticaseibacillus parakribbianus]|uniref:ABC transporter permease n=1 Tax=Lacticaseibacillus parakribbianus TaxID=2970927 RepID=UPI0021CB6F52|nr:ABC transporter permease [Lacticaseibacillus parakribbianus]
MRSAWVVLKQTYRKNVTSAGWLSLVLAPVICALAIAGFAYYLSGPSPTVQVAVVAPKAVAATLVQSQTKTQHYRRVASVAAADKATAAGRYDAVLVLQKGQAQLTQRKGGEQVATTLLETQLAALQTGLAAAKLGLSAEQVASLTAKPVLRVRTATAKAGRLEADAGDTAAGSTVVAVAVGFLLYLFLMTYGSIIAQEIATEKGSRIEESILAAITATAQFMGKILGVAALLLTQVAVYAAALAVAFALRPEWWQLVRPYLNGGQSGVTLGVLATAFVLGVLQYSLLAAGTGALVSSVEQAGMALMPVLMLAMIGYFASIMVPQGGGTVLNALSYIPFTAPLVMPVRVAAGQVGLGAAAVSGAINLVALIGLFGATLRLYRVSVLVYDDRGPGAALRQALGLMRSESRRQA